MKLSFCVSLMERKFVTENEEIFLSLKYVINLRLLGYNVIFYTSILKRFAEMKELCNHIFLPLKNFNTTIDL